MSRKLDRVVDELYKVPKFTSKNSPEHTRAFLRELGDPQEDFAVVHVAGSNGKGSVCAFFGEMFQAAGMRTGMFVSPHLADIRERFLIDGKMCSEEAFLDACETVQAAVGRLQEKGLPHPTFFEILFAAGMLIFSREHVELAVLETGLGGRLDATNIVKRPLLTVITSISLEHTQYLGDTIAQIAGEKAGILKPGVPVIYDASEAEAAAVIKMRAAALGCPVFGVGTDLPEDTEENVCRCRILKFNRKSIDFSLYPAYDRKTDWNIPFVSGYQAMNASLAVTGMRLLRVPAESHPDEGVSSAAVCEETHTRIRQHIAGFSADDLQAALSRTKWPGRMEEVLPDVFLDGAHNTAGIREFAKTVNRLCRMDENPDCPGGGQHKAPAPILLFSMVRDKDYKTAVRILAEEVQWSGIIVTAIPDERGMSTEELRSLFVHSFETVSDPLSELSGTAGLPVIKEIGDAQSAFHYALDHRAENQKIFACGSLYFIGELKKNL